MRMQEKYFRIGELAKQLQVEKSVIRFWEKEFQIQGVRSQGGQRFYKEHDIKTFKLIKTLLYEQGFTIHGAKKHLKLPATKKEIVASCKTTMEEHAQTLPINLRARLIELRALLEKIRASL